MQAFELAQLLEERKRSNKAYLEFLKVPDLSLGLYVLPAGGVDPQLPHREDEVYYVVLVRYFDLRLAAHYVIHLVLRVR